MFDSMNPIQRNRPSLKLAAMIATLCPAAMSAGELPTMAPAPAPDSGLHFGMDPMDFMSGSSTDGIPVGRASYTHVFDADYDTLPGEVSADEFSLLTPILPFSKGPLRVVGFLGYSATSFDSSVPNLLPDDTLHTISLPIAVLYERSEKWLLGGMVIPRLSGDLDNTSDAFNISAFAGFGYRPNPTLRWFGGVFYSDGFGDDFIAPGIGLIWTPSPEWAVILLPPVASVSWQFHEDYFLSLFARFESTTWNVSADSAGPDRDVQMSSTRVGLSLERRVTEHLWAQISAGYSLGREMEIENLDNNNLQEDDIDPAPFVQIGLNLRY